MITATLDVTKIIKERFYKSDKGPIYMDIVLIPTPNSKYDDFLVKQNVRKGEDLKSMPIIGNAKDRSKLSPEEKEEIPF